ncbi:heme/hemin ABC transporter substrate-binding protein [Iodobacter ciconiae]|uniref:Hemin ABC transporter substrate-binding protein n=1 Tax=Iodobacter ciconiae TaxID=2496266 RepID=A0A3S8ZP08_9NEIS|nr:hemin ABC transporter substrate-binding protein [Iodobacter ciconiae]AZN35206.1 hemin ABC transporter substrate-binding protein [Iodobacter ciconiae]
MKKWFIASVLLTLLHPVLAAAPKKIVTLGGSLTEIVYALNAEAHLVAVDQSSIYPPAASKLPKVGYYRAFSVEGVLSQKPDLILASDQAGPPEALAKLQRTGVPVIVLPSAPNLAALEKRISGIASVLQEEEKGKSMIANLKREVTPAPASHTRALLLISRSGSPEGAGNETTADAILKLAGLRNVLAKQNGYKPLSMESIAALQPDVIVLSTMSIQNLGGMEKVLAMPGLAQTPAAKNKKIVVMDDLLLLGFGPRLPEALQQLKQVR